MLAWDYAILKRISIENIKVNDDINTIKTVTSQ